jgi:hypothetical protein
MCALRSWNWRRVLRHEQGDWPRQSGPNKTPAGGSGRNPVLVSRRAFITNISLSVSARFFWTGLAPDDAPLALRDISTFEIYALDWQLPSLVREHRGLVVLMVDRHRQLSKEIARLLTLTGLFQQRVALNARNLKPGLKF